MSTWFSVHLTGSLLTPNTRASRPGLGSWPAVLQQDACQEGGHHGLPCGTQGLGLDQYVRLGLRQLLQPGCDPLAPYIVIHNGLAFQSCGRRQAQQFIPHDAAVGYLVGVPLAPGESHLVQAAQGVLGAALTHGPEIPDGAAGALPVPCRQRGKQGGDRFPFRPAQLGQDLELRLLQQLVAGLIVQQIVFGQLDVGRSQGQQLAQLVQPAGLILDMGGIVSVRVHTESSFPFDRMPGP